MHPAMESRYGHCGAPYCQGYHDALWNRVVPPDDHRAAMRGCTGTGEPAWEESDRAWSYSESGPFPWNLYANGYLIDCSDDVPPGCTAGEALL